MILTGSEIRDEVARGRIVIEPFSEARLEPNSYGFHLSNAFMEYELGGEPLDFRKRPVDRRYLIGDEGAVLRPGRLYLSSTVERMGSMHYAKTLYARLSTAAMGMWIHYSAPLGHTGAIIPWTLEIKVAHPVRVYPGMLIGKIAFWVVEGSTTEYSGKYRASKTVMPTAAHEEAGRRAGGA